MSETERPRPAFTRESAVLRLPGAERVASLTPEWAIEGATGQGVRVAIIDSGVEADHPDLDGCVDAGGGVMFTVGPDGEAVANPGPHDDAFGHGTACAGIIHELAPLATITSVRVLGGMLSGKASAFIAGLRWAIEQGFDVINLSLGTRKREWALPFYELCDEAYFKNSVIVTAANNIDQLSYPSLFASVTSVACSLTNDPRRIHFNPLPPTEFLARGIDVEVAWRGKSRIVATGNSYAAPHVSGLAALVRSKHPELRPFQVKTVLWALAGNVQEAPPVAGRLSRVIMTGADRAGRRSQYIKRLS